MDAMCVSGEDKFCGTYLFTHIAKFGKEKISLRVFLVVLPPSIRFWYEAGRNSVNGFQRLKFALAHVFSRGTQRNDLEYSISYCT